MVHAAFLGLCLFFSAVFRQAAHARDASLVSEHYGCSGIRRKRKKLSDVIDSNEIRRQMSLAFPDFGWIPAVWDPHRPGAFSIRILRTRISERTCG